MKSTRINALLSELSARKTVWLTQARTFFKSQRVRELESRIFDLERQLFQSEQLERIAADKVTLWVGKHDELLIKHKELLASPKL